MKKSSWLAASLLAAASLASHAQADTLSKVKQAGKFVIGTRDSSAPLAYTLGNGKYTGYHVDICNAIAEAVKKEAGLPNLPVDYALVTSQNRLALVVNGTVDVECGSTTNNLTRQKEVAFAPTTYVTNVRMAVKADSGIASVKDLGGKTVATTNGTTSVTLLRRHERASGIDFKQLLGKDHAESFLLVETGRADAFVMDDNILAGLIVTSKSPADFKVVGESLSEEPIAIMYRKDDPAFKKLVDDTVRDLMKSGELAKLYAKWFTSPIPPRNANVAIPMTAALKHAIDNPNDNPAESYKK
jgi:glutamate/aspartate transport system substrate-binding protein